MSLIVFVSTDGGIVVVGDRAGTGAQFALGGSGDLATGKVSSTPKVFAYDNNTIFGVTGLPGIDFITNDGKRIPGFRAASVITDYARTHAYAPDSNPFWEGLFEHVARTLQEKAPPGVAWTPSATDSFMFQAMFAHAPRGGGTWSYRCFRFHVFGGDANGMKAGHEVVPHAMPGICVIGNRLVFDEIIGGTDPRFDDLRKDPTLQPPPGTKFTPATATAFAKRLCAVTSERRLLLEPVDTGHNVSVETDGWIVRETGWQRLYRNE